MIIINEARKIVLKQLFNTHTNVFSMASRKDKNTDNKSEEITDESLGNYRGLIYTMRKDSKVA